MKKLLTFAITLILSNTFLIFDSSAQAPPEGINYQAVARNTSGNALASSTLDVRFSIHDATISGTVVFQETHTSVTTNAYGLFTLVIGSVNTSGFPTINWASGSKFLEVEVNDGGGFVSMGTTQMMSVPYALYAKISGNGPTGATGPVGPTGPTGPAGSANINGTAGNIIKFNSPTSGVNSQIIEDAANNIGIGATPAAGYKLDVTGAGKYSGKLTVGTYTFPNTDGTANQILKTDGAGTLSWTFNNGNTYTNGPGLNLTANTFSLTTTGVTPGTYGSATQVPTFIVDAQGRLTAASNALITVTGTLPTGTTGQTLYNNGVSWLPTNFLYNNNSAIGINTATPAAAAILEIASTTKGILIPRMTAAQRTAISSPPSGLLVYQTDGANGFYYFDATLIQWIKLSNAAPGWSLTGNAGTTAATNFLGTTDAVDLSIKANNKELIRLDNANSQIRLGTTPTISGTGISGRAFGSNLIVNGNQATAMGNKVEAKDLGSFIIGDWSANTPALTQSSKADEMTMRFNGGYRFFTTSYLGADSAIYFNNGNVGVGISNPNAKVDVKGTVAMGGFRMPTGANANYVLTSDASGNGTWKPAGGGGGWALNGNPGTDPSVNYIGTTDLRHLVFRTNNIERMKIDSLGNVGIGITKPKNKLSVKGSMAVNVTQAPNGYTINSNDYIVEFPSGSSAGTLPVSSSVENGTLLILRSKGVAVTITAGAGDQILRLTGGTVTNTSIVSGGVLRLYLSGNLWMEW